MKIIDHFSPNFKDRHSSVDMIILHYTDMKNAEDAIERLCDPKAQVSAHYLISKSGEINRLVPEDKVAYHAGLSTWRGRSFLNENSIGIELDNLGHSLGPEEFSDVQLKSLIWLLSDIRTRHTIPDHHIIGHADVAPLRKKDPGELFPWEFLAQQGHGLWASFSESPLPDELDFYPSPEDYLEAQKNLAQIGYAIKLTGSLTEETEHVLLAFQRHFLPLNVTGLLDKETFERLKVVKDLFS